MDGDRKQGQERGDRLKQLRTFCHAARLGSISRAAEHVMSSQPAVSLQIRTLEQELGLRLFDRHGPRVTLTWVGESLYRLAMPLVAGMDRLPDNFAEQHFDVLSDSLRIGAGQTSAAHLLPKYLVRFREQYPELHVDVRVDSGHQRLTWLRDYELDLIVTAMDFPPSDVEFHRIHESEIVLIVPEDHPLAGRNRFDPREITAYPLVVHSPMHRVRQSTEVILRANGIDPQVVIEVDGWDTIKGYVAAGAGIAFVPDVCVTERDALWKISGHGAAPSRVYGVVTRRGESLGLAARRFLELMVTDPPATPGEP